MVLPRAQCARLAKGSRHTLPRIRITLNCCVSPLRMQKILVCILCTRSTQMIAVLAQAAQKCKTILTMRIESEVLQAFLSMTEPWTRSSRHH